MTGLWGTPILRPAATWPTATTTVIRRATFSAASLSVQDVYKRQGYGNCQFDVFIR